MRVSRRLRTSVFGLVLACFAAAPAFGQGLLNNLPDEDGVGVRYEGTYRQLVKRPNAVEGDTTIQWSRRLRIASVGREEAEYRGQLQPCRWIEFRVQTGRPKEGDIDAGPGSTRIYKVLVPESAVRGTIDEPIAENRQIFVSYIPIVRGFRKIGDEPAQPIEPPVLQARPVLTQLHHYRNLMPDGAPGDFQAPAGNFDSQLYKGSQSAESTTQRSASTAEIYRSDAIPFGLVKWTVKTVVEEKPTTAPRTDYVITNEITEEMSAFEILNGVDSELITD
ncbi:MAG: hypothetical protein KF774_13630 [Planctomyces sp.]|nr:hypothetical protein [Planctomyces sp.]